MKNKIFVQYNMPKTLARCRDNQKSIYGLVDQHAYWLNQSLITTGSPTFSNMTITNDLTVGGDFTVSGMTTVINTDVLTIKDNIIEINSTEVGPGVTVPSGLSGIQVSRGASVAYQSVFRESDDAFCIGQVGDLQVVATRQDNPLNNGIMIFNNAQKRLDAVTTLPLTVTFSSNEVANTSSTGTIRVQGGMGITGDTYSDGRLYLKGTNYNNYIYTDASQNFTLNSSNTIKLNATSSVDIPTGIPITFSSTSHFISGNGTNLTMASTGSINLQSGSGLPVNINTNSPLTFGASTEKITYNGTNIVLDAANSFIVNPSTSFTNTSSTSGISSGAVKISGGVGISNTTDATSSSNGGTITTGGGVGIGKKLYVAGISTFENTNETISLSVSGGVTVNKKLIVGSNYSGNPTTTTGIFIQSPGSTFTDNATSASGVVTSVNFNYLGINALAATNSNVSTTNSSTLYIDGSPVAGTNQTITNRYSIYVNSGITRLNGDTQIKSTTYSTSLTVDGGATINKNLNVNSKFDVGADITSAPSSSGVFLAFSSRTVTDDVTVSGVVSEMLFNVIAQPTLSSTNVITTTNSATFVIDGAPLQAGNQTLTNTYSMWIKSGAFKLDSSISISGLSTFSNSTEATSSGFGSITISGGVGIGKKLYVAGVSTFENVLASTNTTTAGTVVLGGLAVVKNVNIGQVLHTGVDNFGGAPGLGRIFKTGGNVFTDTTTAASGTQTTYSTNEFKQMTLEATNTVVTTTTASTLYVAGPTIAGTNQSITNNYSMYIESGNTRLGGNLTVNGAITLDNGLIMQGALDVNGLTTLDQVSIVTDDGQFSVSGTNPVNINVAANITTTNTTGTITIDAQAGALVLDGNNNVTIDSLGSISIDAGTSSNLNVAVGTLTIGAPTLAISSTATTIDATSTSNGIKIGTLTSGVPITIGHTISETVVADNLTVIGDFTVQGDTTILNSTVITTEDNAVVVNSLPAGVSDGGLLVRRYQTPNNTSLGRVITDTAYETGAFQGHLTLDAGASATVNYYRGWWIKITSGAGSSFVRRIKTSDASRVITIYVTADNTANFTDGLDLGVTITSGDTYNLYPGSYAGMFFNDTLKEWSIGNVPFDSGAGVFPLHGYRDLHINTLLVDAGLTITGVTNIEGRIIVDNDHAQTMLVRKNGAAGDVFYIDSVTPAINISNPVNTVNSASIVKMNGYDSVSAEVLYTQISSKIKVNTTTAVAGELSLGVVRNSVLQNYIVMDGNAQTTTVNSLTNITDTTSSTSSTAALKVTGGITSLVSTDATSLTSGGGITTVGGASIGKKFYVGTDAFFNADGTGSATIKMGPSTANGESSMSFYGNLSYSGQNWKIGHGVGGLASNEFGLYNATATTLAISVTTAGVVSIPATTASVGTTSGALVVSGGVGIALDLFVGGNVSGTWNGSTVSVGKGGTGATSFTSTAVLLGNGTSAIQAGSGITYATNTLTLPKIISNDATDASSSVTGAVNVAGGLGVAKKLYVGTDLDVGGNITFSGTDTNIGHTTVDASDTGSISIFAGGAYGDTRGANILIKGNEHASDAGKIVMTCGNVNSTGYFSVVTSSSERFKVGYDGIITATNALDATSSTAGAVVMAGGLAVAKKLYVGTDLSVSGNFSFGTVTSGTWNGSTITVGYGGTGATTLLSTGVLLGNGTSAVQTNAGLTFATTTLTVPKLASTDTTQSTSSSTGAVTLLGGMGVTKNVYMGEGLYVSGMVGVGTTTNVNSALTIATGSNIGVNTVISFDTGSLSISGSGVGLASRGSIVNLYGIDHATLPGTLDLQAGTTAGSLKLTTAGTARVTITSGGITTFSKTGDSTSSTVAQTVFAGGVSVSNATNASSNTTGGSLTVGGGCAIAQDVYIGGNLYMTGTIPGATTITSPSVATSVLTNITTAVAANVKLRKVGVERSLSCVVNVVPSAIRSTCSFRIELPEVTTNLVNSYDIVASMNGYLIDFTPVENMTCYGVSGSLLGKVRFTSGATTDAHTIQLMINYTIS